MNNPSNTQFVNGVGLAAVALNPTTCSPAHWFGWLLVLVVFSINTFAAERITLLGDGDSSGWEQKSFEGETRYETVALDGRQAVRATSDGSASGLFNKRRIDLHKTPILNWFWRVDEPLDNPNERTRGGDDYAARVFVVNADHPLFIWKTKAVNYVWSSEQEIGDSWANPYTCSSQHIALRSGDTYAGQWVRERRNVRADFKALFDKDIRYIHAVAIMTDTDNTGAHAVAWYGDIFFSAE